jgi:hypothetical protein
MFFRINYFWFEIGVILGPWCSAHGFGVILEPWFEADPRAGCTIFSEQVGLQRWEIGIRTEVVIVFGLSFFVFSQFGTDYRRGATRVVEFVGHLVIRADRFLTSENNLFFGFGIIQEGFMSYLVKLFLPFGRLCIVFGFYSCRHCQIRRLALRAVRIVSSLLRRILYFLARIK